MCFPGMALIPSIMRNIFKFALYQSLKIKLFLKPRSGSGRPGAASNSSKLKINHLLMILSPIFMKILLSLGIVMTLKIYTVWSKKKFMIESVA